MTKIHSHRVKVRFPGNQLGYCTVVFEWLEEFTRWEILPKTAKFVPHPLREKGE